MLDGRVLEASQVEYKPFGKPPLKREVRLRTAEKSSKERDTGNAGIPCRNPALKFPQDFLLYA